MCIRDRGGTVCRIPVTRYEPEQETESPAFCFFVRKDSGDDPDVTNGTKIYASVRQVDRNEFESLCHAGAGYYLKEYPQLYLNGGRGIGMVTKPGLSCPVGHITIRGRNKFATSPSVLCSVLLFLERIINQRVEGHNIFHNLFVPWPRGENGAFGRRGNCTESRFAA